MTISKAWSHLVMFAFVGCAARAPTPIRDAPKSESAHVGPLPRPKPSAATDRGATEAPQIIPCTEGPELDEALAELRSVDAAIDQLPISADPRPLAKRLESLYRRRCFDVGEVALDAERIDSALTLQEFWKDARTELFERLAWGKADEHFLWALPSLRHALTIDVAPQHPLRPLLCPSDPKNCGIETAGWAKRAENALSLRAELRHGRQTHEPCTGRMSFIDFSQCIQRSALTHEALPLGRFRAPTDGWLLLRGPNIVMDCSAQLGSAGVGARLRAYDLATGSAWSAQSCGGNAVARSGTLPVASLREAAWMIFLAGTVDEIQQGGRQQIPPEVAIMSPTVRVRERGGMRRGQTSRHVVWQWVRGNSTAASGVLDRVLASEDHATELLEIAEASFVDGPARTPVALPWKERKLHVVGEKAPPEESDPLYDELESVLARAIAATRGRPLPGQ